MGISISGNNKLTEIFGKWVLLKMSDKFEPRQKELVDAETGSFEASQPEYPSRVKSDIRNGPAHPETFVRRVREFAEYVEYVEKFYRSVEEQPRGQVTWELQCQPMVQTEARGLRRKMQNWIPTESPDTWGQQFEKALKPLWNDLDSFHKRDDVPTPSVERDLEHINPENPEDVPADADELEARIKALNRVLEDITQSHAQGEYLHELLRSVSEGKQIEGKEQKRRTTYHLCPSPNVPKFQGHHGLVTEIDSGHTMTERGRKVRETFENITSLWGLPVEQPSSSEAATRAEELQEIVELAFELD